MPHFKLASRGIWLRHRWLVGAGAAAVTIIAVLGVLWLTLWRSPSPLARIQNQAASILFYPNPSDGWQLDPTSLRYNTTQKVVFLTYRKADLSLIITEQATPDPFNDIPGYYAKLIENLQGYQVIGTAFGNADLTRPTELKGQQSAVLNTQGTLMFMRPSRDMNADDWRRLFNHLQKQQ